MRPVARRFVLVLLAAGLLASGLLWLRRTPAPAAASSDVVAALARAVVPIGTSDPGSDLDDLRPLLRMLAHHRIVALGEATHGTREFFQLKHRLVQLLVAQASFTIFAIETDPERARAVNAWIRYGEGSAADAIGGLEFWTWKTEEVLALVHWLREWNMEHPEREVSFAGINATGRSRDREMAENVHRVLDEAGPGARMVLWAHNGHVATDPGWMGDYLRQRYGDDLYVAGLEFGSGAFRSRNVFGLRDHAVGEAGPGYYAHALSRLSWPIVFLDFRSAARDATVARWLAGPRLSRNIDELFYVRRFAERFHSRSDPWPTLYDGVLFVRDTTPARGLPQ